MICPRAVYAGSFDPPTRGHRWVIDRARQIFSDLEVLVAENAGKKSLFDFNTRVAMLKTMHDKVTVLKGQMVAEYAFETNAMAIVRGVRSGSEFDYEATIASVNSDITGRLVQTVFFIPPPDLRHVSSTMVKSLVGLEGWEDIVKQYVTPAVLEIMKKEFSK